MSTPENNPTPAGGGGGGDASAANQATQIAAEQATQAAVESLNTKAPTLGQAAMAASVPVAIASNQSAIPVSAASLPLPTDAATSARQDTGNASLASIDGKLPSLSAGRVPVDASGVTLATRLSNGTSFYNAASAGDNMGADLRVFGNAVTDVNPVPISDAGGSLTVDGSVSISGTPTVTANAGTGTFAISAASLPLPTGAATAAKQPALGTAGTPSADVITVQGIGSGTAIPISGSVTADTELPPAAALGDALAANTSTVFVGAGAFIRDGSSWARWQGTTAGGAYVQGATANGAANSGNPVRIAGSDGGNTRNALCDTSGRLITVQTGTDSGGTNRTASITPSGSQIVTFDGSNLGPFGDLIADSKTPVLTRHWTVLNAVDPQQDEIVTQANGATVSITSQRLTFTSGTTNAADACYRTIKTAQYRPGQGFVFRWTAAFTTNAASSTQEIGFGNGANGGGRNAIAVGYNGNSFGILYRNAGVSTWYTQAQWTGDKLNGSGASGITISPALLNVFFAHVPFLGAGTIHFYAMLPNGTITRIHSINYPNSSASLEFSDPAFRFYGRVVSTGSTTNLVAYAGSAAAFTVGEIGHDGQQFAINRTASVNGTAAVLSVRCATTVNGALNNTPLRIRSISFTGDNGNTTSTGVAAVGVTLGGTPAFVAFDGLSATTADNGVTLTSATTIGTYDIAGTTVTGGSPIWNAATPRNSPSSSGELEKNPIFVWPGQTLTFYATTGAATNVTYAINGTVG